MDELLKIQEEALAKIAACADAKELNDVYLQKILISLYQVIVYQ